MEREVKKFTPSGGGEITVEFKTYLTGREMDEWRALFLDYFKSDVKGNLEDIKVDGKLLALMEKKAIEIAVYSFNGSKENILNRILDLPVKQYREIADEALKLMEQSAEFFASKKKQ